MDFGFRIYNFVMGVFKIKCKIENIKNRKKTAIIPQMLVDTVSEYTWIMAKTLEEFGIEREKKGLDVCDGKRTENHAQRRFRNYSLRQIFHG